MSKSPLLVARQCGVSPELVFGAPMAASPKEFREFAPRVLALGQRDRVAHRKILREMPATWVQRASQLERSLARIGN
jgi:hypothetical protein